MADANNTQRSILIVEDEVLLSDLLKTALKDPELVIDVVNDGSKVVETAKAKRYNLIFLDILLPGVNGFAILQQLRTDGYYKTVPIIMLTNLGKIEDINKARTLGATDYLIKSNIDYTKIKTLLETHLKGFDKLKDFNLFG